MVDAIDGANALANPGAHLMDTRDVIEVTRDEQHMHLATRGLGQK